MNVVGIGIDVIEVRVVERMIQELGERFLRLALCPAELERLPDPAGQPIWVSRNLAAKEAAMKALGLGLGPSTTWRAFEVLDGPRLELRWRHGHDIDVEFRIGISRSPGIVIATAWALAPVEEGATPWAAVSRS